MAKILEVKYENLADAVVCEVHYETQADLCWYEVAYAQQAEGDAKWFFVQHETQADFKIFKTKYETQADLKIFRSSTPTRRAGATPATSCTGSWPNRPLSAHAVLLLLAQAGRAQPHHIAGLEVPGRRFCPRPTPAGVPVSTMSPGSSVMNWLMYDTTVGTQR